MFVGLVPMDVFESIDFVSEWTKTERDRLGWSQAELAALATERLQATGAKRTLKQQTIDQLEKRDHKGVPDWFRHVRAAIDGAKEAKREEARAVARAARPIEPDLPVAVPDDIEMIPELDISYAMGDGSVIADYPETGQVPFNRQFRRTLTRAPVEALFLARGDGDSMMPTLINDDQVLIDTSQTRITQSDRIWALAIGEAGMIKRVRVLPQGRVELHSDNVTIRPQEVALADLTVIGRVIWVGRRV